MEKRKVCLFGLSADPPTNHQGHVGIIHALMQRNEWDEIWILPVYRHTYEHKRKRLVSFEHRLQMCERAIQHLGSSSSPRVVVSDLERRSWEYATRHLTDEAERAAFFVGTAALLDYLQVQYPNHEFCLCFGADSFLDLLNGKWRQSQVVLRHQNFCVLHRAGVEFSERIKEAPGTTLLTILELGDISSSKVRECTDVEALKSMVLPAVLEYMKENHLYQFAGNDSII